MAYTTNTFTASAQSGSTTVNSGAPQSSTYTDTGTTPGSGAQVLRDGSTFYDTSSSRVEQLQRVDVTDQIQQYHMLYGGSDNTQQGGLAASKSLNYANAPTMQQAQPVFTSVFPYTFKLTGQIGLFGTENYYLRVDVDLLTPLDDEQELDGYLPARFTFSTDITINTYEPAQIDYDQDPPPPNPAPGAQAVPEQQADRHCCVFIGGVPSEPIFNCYYGVLISSGLPNFWDPVVSVDLNNIGVNNIYIDTWLDTMLYTRERKMWGYDKMYVRPKDHFYVGLHARNTRHLPYNVNVTVGTEYIQSDEVADKKLIATNTLAY
jgi:hypothetical protein